MDWQNTRRLLSSDYLYLVPILALAFYIAFIPHQTYPYPLHVDEWVHWARSGAMMEVMEAGSNTFPGEFLLEAGFYLFWGVFQTISGISWLTIFRYFPGIIFMITVLSVYIMARRQGFGWEAALFTCLIPTTVEILGPAFLVPVAMGLLFTPLILFLAFNFRTVWSYLLIFIFICFLLSIHAPSAICPIIVLTPYILLNLKGNFKHSLGMALAVAIPFLIIFPWIFDMLLPTAKSLLTPQPFPPYIGPPLVLQWYGYLPILFCLLGTFLLAIRGGKRNYSLILGFLALLVMLVTYYTFQYGVDIMYFRGLMYMMLMMSIVAGAGLMWVKNLRLPARLSTRLRAPQTTQNVGYVLCLALIGLTLVIAIPDRQDTPYHHYIDQQDYQAFIWIKENVDDEYKKVILDPWKATAFAAITGRDIYRDIYSRIQEAPKPSDTEAYEFLRGGCSDTAFLRANGLSIIYTRVYEFGQNKNIEYSSDNPDLEEQIENVYLLK